MRRFVFVLFLLALPLPASAQTQHRKTVLDYFKMLPVSSGFFDSPEKRIEDLQSGSPVVDTAHDYLSLQGDGAQPSIQMAVFRYRGQDTILAAANDGENQWIRVYRKANGRLRDVSEQIFPRNVFPFWFSSSRSDEVRDPSTMREDVFLIVPRYGTTLRILKLNSNFQPTSKVLARFFWRGGRFVRG